MLNPVQFSVKIIQTCHVFLFSSSTGCMVMIIAVVGKGGVGKTSVASAIALELSRIGKTLIVSTDFMPSLEFIFTGADPLSVMELSEEGVSKEWEKVYGKQVMEIAGEFMEADDEIIHHISSAPGVPEEFMISSIIEQEKSGAFDFIVWDTPASSSTMHLLALERDFYNHLNRDVKFYLKLKKKFRISKTIEILDAWKQLAEDTWAGLERVNFILVSTMDELALRQSDTIKSDLGEMGFRVAFKICNRVKRGQPVSGVCSVLIEEETGSAREIVEAIRPQVSSALGLLSVIPKEE